MPHGIELAMVAVDMVVVVMVLIAEVRVLIVVVWVEMALAITLLEEDLVTVDSHVTVVTVEGVMATMRGAVGDIMPPSCICLPMLM